MASEPYFVLTLPLKPDIRQQHILEKRFAVNGWIYNALLQKAGKRYRQMAQTKAFRRIREALATESDKAVRKELLQEREQIRQKLSSLREELEDAFQRVGFLKSSLLKAFPHAHSRHYGAALKDLRARLTEKIKKQELSSRRGPDEEKNLN